MALYENEDYDKTIDEFTDAIRLDSNYALAYKQFGQINQAIQDFKKAVKLNSKSK